MKKETKLCYIPPSPSESVTIRVSEDKNTIYIVEDKSKDKEIIHKKEEKVGYFFSS